MKHVAKAQQASGPSASVQKAEPATIAGVPHYSIATPRVPDADAAKGSDEPIQELKTPAVLAQEAKAKLDELLKGGASQQKPAVGDDKPHLPTLSGFMTPTEAIKTPPNESPKGATKQQQMMGTTELIELVKALAQRDEKDKPKTKEAELIKLNNMPAPESYRTWKNHVRDEVKSCPDRPDEAWAWLNEVYDQDCTREELEKKLQEPGKFLTLDTKLSAALTRSAGGDLATRILNFKEQQSRKGIQVRGRYVLLMFEDYFKTSEEAGSLYRVEDLLGVVKVGDTAQDLRRFINKWDATLAGMAVTPDDAVLRDILLRQIRPSHLLKYDIEVFDRAHEKSHEKSYGFLHQSMKNLIDRERLRENRNRIAEKNKAGVPKDTKAAPAKGDGRGGRKGSPSRGRSQERGGIRVTRFATSSKRVNAIRGRSVLSSMLRMINPEHNPPEELRHVHHQGAKRMIRGRRCPKKKWLRPHASILPRESADEGTNVFINMRTKLLLPPKTPKGQIHPLPKGRRRIPMPLRA